MHTTGAAAGGCAAAPCCSVSELDPMPPASFVTLMGIVDMQLAGQWPASHTQTITAGAAGARAARRATKARRSHRRSRRGEGLFELDEYELPGQPGARPWEVDLKALRTAPKADDLYRKYQREIDQEPHELTLRNKKLSLLRELSRSNFEDVRRLLLGESLKDPEPEHNDGEATSDSSSHSQCECVCDLAMFGDYDRILKGELERTAVRGASRRQIPAVGIQWSNVLSSIGDLSKVEAPVGQTEEPRPPTLRTAHTLKSAIDGVLPSGSTARRQLDDALLDGKIAVTFKRQ
ncbi:hypothetical protein AB1Y20_015691 [Prymnesium parvum]|uniref:Uncharacterized protein n=1 Tax=Prymnesium parvum TaxID=97485 RepID=A0AB34K1I8_PRYPA